MSDEPSQSQQQAELEGWLQWLGDLRNTAAALLRLASAELQLAAGDLRRFLVLSLLVLPVGFLAWLGLALFLCWLVYTASGSMGAAFAGFFMLHFIILLVIQRLLVRYRKSMSLPATRGYLADIVEEFKRAPQRTDTADSDA
ncbi:MAG: hypothetical protein WEB57_08785 [Pseudohongiellaceae bacterium]